MSINLSINRSGNRDKPGIEAVHATIDPVEPATNPLQRSIHSSAPNHPPIRNAIKGQPNNQAAPPTISIDSPKWGPKRRLLETASPPAHTVVGRPLASDTCRAVPIYPILEGDVDVENIDLRHAFALLFRTCAVPAREVLCLRYATVCCIGVDWRLYVEYEM
ncbi:uncharacterized protein N7511_009166 [Penicillium nucicola]|uniref:uncharacterized protein n=1 Tax=Penicillium nucicola TaxID=1850975 RepID=UPI002544DC06|nr:uncharacterized protein N7511_009166 [Penicillium nucicola]KAJ5747470.1 hypothetical protein N7511_009166 [Penicillium nucicola]